MSNNENTGMFSSSSILESISVPIYYLNIDGVFLGCNKEFLNFFAATKKEVIGKTFFDLIPREYAQLHYENDQMLLANPGKQIFKWKFPDKKGNSKNATIHKATFSNKNAKIAGIVGTIFETTTEDKLREALYESEIHFRELTETTPIAVLIYQDNKYVYANQAASTITEYSREELLGKEFWDFVHPDDREKVIAAGTKRQSGEKTISRYQFKILTKQGKVKWVDLAGSTTSFKGKAAGIISVNDITDMVRSNEELEESRARANFLANVTFEGILIHEKGKVIDANDSFCKITGFNKEEVIGNYLLDYIPLAKDRLKILSNIIKKRAKPYLVTGKRKDGTRFMAEVEARDVKIDGKTIRIAAIRDVTEKVKTERALKKSEERLELALEGASLGLWDMNYITGEVFRSKMWAEMLGYKLEELENVEEFWINLIHPDDRERVIEEGKIAKHRKDKIFRSEHRLLCKDGSYKWILSWGQFTAYDKSGMPTRSVGVHIDIDNIKKAEEEIQRLLLSKDILLKEVHHRIKNNMSALASFLSIQARISKNAEAEGILTEAKSRVQAMGVLYNKLYRKENYKYLEIAEYTSSLIDEIIQLYPAGEDLIIEKDLMEFSISAKYFFPLGILINEIITNSMKYAFKGIEKKKLSIRCRKEDNRVTILIADNGIGLPEQIDSSSGGFGLELIDMLVAQIKGNLSVKRENGTEYVIDFEVFS